MKISTKYPVYIPSKNRAKSALTARWFKKWNLPFYLVVEPEQVPLYEAEGWGDYLLPLPEDNMRLLGSRLWIREHSIKDGYDRHWQFDDNIRSFYRLHRGCRIRVDPNKAIEVVEEFTDRYTNIGISGFDYEMFVVDTCKKPYVLNVHVYSATLCNNRMPYKWRLYYNDDTDICLQVLHGGLCTVQFKTLMVEKMRTLTVKGGNTDDLYKHDGRLLMARSLEEVWPQYVETAWRFGRPQHRIKNNWNQFTTQLKRNHALDWDAIKKTRYSFKLKQHRDSNCWQMKNFKDEQNEQN
jgi:hypothetical protein